MNPTFAKALFTLGALLGSSLPATAGDEARKPVVPLLPAYRQECAACHVAYAPGLLPAASWRALMTRLPQHFGTDASLDPSTVAELSAWLVSNAATREGMRTPPPDDRITRAAWFAREHGEITPSAWLRAAVRGPSNCIACHARADQGIFDEHDVRIPR
ncbi:MAG TPA: diheme cytochrome c [Burkholderiaceae bacterium]|nr:diheme cytochrome c [Burkholderiaceae bacterium]